jgi:hypothetical protein
LLFGFFFFPFPLISKTNLLASRCFNALQAKKNVSQNRLFCQAPFAFLFLFFFKFFFIHQKPEKIKLSASLPPSYRNIKKNNQLLLFQSPFGVINIHL